MVRHPPLNNDQSLASTGREFQNRKTDLRCLLPLGGLRTNHQTKSCLIALAPKGFGSEQLETCSFKDRFVSAQTQINDTWDFSKMSIITNCDQSSPSYLYVTRWRNGKKPGFLSITFRLALGLEGDITFWYPLAPFPPKKG